MLYDATLVLGAAFQVRINCIAVHVDVTNCLYDLTSLCHEQGYAYCCVALFDATAF